MLLIGSIVFLALAMVGITIYTSYRVFGNELSVWSGKGALLTWLPLMVGLLVAMGPISYSTYDGYAQQNERDEVITTFLEEYPDTEQLVRADKGETWLFSYMNGGAMHTTLLIGGQYLDIQAGPIDGESPPLESETRN